MSQLMSAKFDGKVIIPDEPLDFSPGQRLQILIQAVDGEGALIAQLPPELELRDDGVITVRGHRISLHLILEAVYQGVTTEQIQHRYPSIASETLQRVLEFCQQRSELVRRYYEQQQTMTRQYCDPAHQGPSADELRNRWSAANYS